MHNRRCFQHRVCLSCTKGVPDACPGAGSLVAHVCLAMFCECGAGEGQQKAPKRRHPHLCCSCFHTHPTHTKHASFFRSPRSAAARRPPEPFPTGTVVGAVVGGFFGETGRQTGIQAAGSCLVAAHSCSPVD